MLHHVHFYIKGGKKSFSAVASLDCPSGGSRHLDKRINGVSFCGAEGGSEPKVADAAQSMNGSNGKILPTKPIRRI